MGSQQSKCKSLYLPAQSGKTRKMEELIKEYKLGELFDPVDINIIISANNRLLVEQTKTRMKNDLGSESEKGASDACIKGSIFSWTSGTKKSNITPEALTLEIMNDTIEMVIICAHAKRIEYLSKTFDLLSKQFHFTKKINIWIDEADFSINLWSKYQKVIELPFINQVTLVSATFDAVVAKYKELRVLPYLKTHPDCYVGLRQALRKEINFAASSAIEYVTHIITSDDKLSKPGMRAFIPGANSTTSHDAIAEFLHKERGFVVIIINGQRKEILVPGKDEPIDLKDYLTVQEKEIPEEFNTLLAKLYKDNNWSRFPLAITGYMCVQRGVTFQCGSKEGIHDGFLFDYGIIPPNIKCAAEAYQTMARLFGNIGNIQEYKPVEIFTNERSFMRVEKQEETARNIARMVAEQSIDVVTKNELKSAEAPHKRVPHIIQLDDQQLQEIMKKRNSKAKEELIKEFILSNMGEIRDDFRTVITTQKCFQISAPKIETKRSYKIHVLDVVAAASNGSVYGMMDIKDGDKQQSGWQVFIDAPEKRLVVLWEVFQ
jgi:hypothetical protein